MRHYAPLFLFVPLICPLSRAASPLVENRAVGNAFDTNPDGSTFLWILQDEYSGSTFFDRFDFFTGEDPTHGTVHYVERDVAFNNSLAYVQDDGIVVMKGDDTNWLAPGENRSSVRISSQALYNTGLFVLDVNRAPWGCGVWPAWWTLGNGQWPYNGEIDIIEGVHDNVHNQVAWHTGGGCYLTQNANFTGSITQLNGEDNLFCKSDDNFNDNSGCAITEWSRSSYGPDFDRQGGGVFAMKWDENGIAVWSFFRAAVPGDVYTGSPNPSNWGTPSANLSPEGCNITQYFANHSIIFDITFCGDWAGNSYATSECPGTCPERLQDPANFVNATWNINSLKVYRKQLMNGRVSGASSPAQSLEWVMRWISLFGALVFLASIYV
ncbi:glycoside hydrolase family 16 protein [Dendrothele bispora CBS 962.96]|uniref:Glycoside hydrolase family 16 protein n=1 Tax=Dendrothele bispora (strain CBS 962.96) TaxID=1314807 RepID=A0A4S8MQP9_DENBC|nr:glycoside hydrolase family 16 protein [Dendrothele bispora CBS 962.96]